jgi:hypothetical protein
MSKDLKVGDHVNFLRSHNKAVELSGTICKIYDDAPVVDVKLDDHDPDWIETAHVDDVTMLEEKKEEAKPKAKSAK